MKAAHTSGGHASRRQLLRGVVALGAPLSLPTLLNLGSATAQAQAAPPRRRALAPVSAYAALPGARLGRLSPSGQRLALIAPLQGRSALQIRDLQQPALSRHIPLGEGEPQWLVWKSEQVLLLSLQISSARISQQRTQDRRLISLDLQSGRVVELVQADEADYVPQFQDQVLSLLPEDHEHLLIELPRIDRFSRSSASAAVARERELHPEVQRVDLRSGRTERVQAQHGAIGHWLADAQGRLRAGWERKSAQAIELYAPAESAGWRRVNSLTLAQGRSFTPVAAVSGQPSQIIVSAHRDSERLGLHVYDLAEGRWLRTLAASEDGDVEPLLRHGELLGWWLPGQRLPDYLDPRWAETAKLVARALPDAGCELIDRSQDGQRWLLRVQRGQEPIDFWQLHGPRGRQVLEPLTDSYPGLEPEQLAISEWSHYRARDGLQIPALLTLPLASPQAEAAARRPRQPLPFVVLPHGGPTSQDRRGFDPLVQLLASRGYGVMQPQFRGSTGQGLAFQQAGRGQWGQTMQDDVTDGTHWLIEQGLADPARIAIVGGSYGGYAALMGLVKEPKLYRCAVAFAAVTDLALLVDELWRYVQGELNLPAVGTDLQVLRQHSPAHQAARIERPLLLVHGRRDFTVPVAHSERLAGALNTLGRAPRTLFLDQADHSFSRGEDRLALFQALLDFLVQQLGPADQPG